MDKIQTSLEKIKLMNAPKRPCNLLKLNSKERERFLNSFDTVLCDCDGVVWQTMQQPLPGVGQGIEFLQDNGKKIFYVTNNSVRSPEEYMQKFKNAGIKAEFSDVIHPARMIISYLQKVNFHGLIYCIATRNFKQILTEAGYTLIDGPNKILDENFNDLAKNVFDKAPVKAVIIDVDYNLSAPKLIRAHLYLKNPDCILIGGAADRIIPFGDSDIIGAGAYIKIVENSSGRKAILLGKPGKQLGEMIKGHLQIENPGKVLFIGDSLESDIGFAHQFGYQTLLVLSGATNLQQLQDHDNYDEIPDYYVDSLSDFIKFFHSSNNKL